MITVDVTKIWIQRKYLQTKYLVRKLIQNIYKKFAFQENLATDINMFFPLRQKNKVYDKGPTLLTIQTETLNHLNLFECLLTTKKKRKERSSGENVENCGLVTEISSYFPPLNHLSVTCFYSCVVPKCSWILVVNYSGHFFSMPT